MNDILHTDVMIIGAGAAGIAAAVAVANSGKRALIIERLSFPGGRAKASAVGTICGTFLRSPQLKYAMHGFPKFFTDHLMQITKKEPVQFAQNLWFIPAPPSDVETTARHFLEHKNIRVLYNASVENIITTGKNIDSIEVLSDTGRKIWSANALVDTSGHGVAIEKTNHKIVPAENKQADSIIFSMKGIMAENEFSLNLIMLKYITANHQKGNIPEYFNWISLIPSSYNRDTAMFKLGLQNTSEISTAEEKEKAEKMIYEIVDFLRSNVPQFKKASIEWVADEIGQRSGQRPLCRYTLSENDVLICKKTYDSIANGSWPIEFWVPGNKKVQLTYFQEEDYYSIPVGCLISEEFNNLYFAGKLISSTERAIASARVIGTCLGTGYAAGTLASFQINGQSEVDAIKHIQTYFDIAI